MPSPLLSLEALRPYYVIRDTSMKSSMFFYGSRIYAEFNTGENFHPWDKVAPHLFLGKIPGSMPFISSISSLFAADEKQQAKQIFDYVTLHDDYPLKLVVSVIECHEFAYSGVMQPIEWDKYGVRHLLLPIKDETADLSNECFSKVIEMIDETHKMEGSVYVHCKAGMGRSATVCAMFLGARGDESMRKMDEVEIEAYLKSKRLQVELKPVQRRKLAEIIKLLRSQDVKDNELENEVACDDFDIPPDINPTSLNESITDFTIIDKTPHVIGEKLTSVEISSSDFKDKVVQSSDSEDRDELLDLKKYLSSLEFKNALIHFTSFKQLAIKACQGAPSIKEFFEKIYKAENADWISDMANQKELLELFEECTFLTELKDHLELLDFNTESIEQVFAACDMNGKIEIVRSPSAYDFYTY
ncbi:MAG: hypothetical protein A3F14_02355 [Gammaproteobacteria bacterium RIFCSPHIGHO2_12_FULL_43_28]|nr:MAG: hypothetical protein A3F14_02355 [Gammaproteobacteria bacterium RIFCSPHIGHO2_12_FULL_43_28]